MNRGARRALQALAVALCGFAAGLPLLAAPPEATVLPAAASVSGPAWTTLAPARQQALAPIRRGWDALDAIHKMKWIEVADRFPGMPADERRRVQERMAAWAAMTPNERAGARVQFQETRRIGAEARQERWRAYQALPDDERKRLALAARKPPAPSASGASRAAKAATPDRGSGKRNLVASTPSPPPRAVAPTVVQARPGASTTTVSTQARPPMHHQPGLPKIVATPGFVDPATLLPRRGPQAAAMRTAASSDPTRQP